MLIARNIFNKENIKLTKKNIKVTKKEHKLEMKQKWGKDNTKKIMRQPRNRAEWDIFLQVPITREEIHLKIKFITNQEQLDEFKKSESLGYYSVQYCEKNPPTSVVSMKDGDFWNHIKNIVMLLLGQSEIKFRALQNKIQKYVCGNHQSVIKIIDVNPLWLL